MSGTQADIIVLGATGCTGRLITRYLAAHPQFTQGLFSFSVAARSQSKLHTLVQQLSLPPTINVVQVDITDDTDLEKAVRSAKVVINAVGPYWPSGLPVVRACAINGIHYLDLTGETHWIKEIIDRYDYIATKTGAIIVPSCGLESIPSDLSAFLGNKTLKSHGAYDVGLSTTAIAVSGGIPDGTWNTIMTLYEDVPKHQQRESMVDYALSPVVGRIRPRFQLFYHFSIPGERPTAGWFLPMQPINRALVQRTFGLLELQALDESNRSNTPMRLATKERYGPTFAYDEFLAMRSKTWGFFLMMSCVVGMALMTYITPIRWVVQKLIPKLASRPSDEDLQKGFLTAKNLTISTSTPPIRVKTVIKGNGDPGFLLSSIMISESALSLLLPPPSETASYLVKFVSTSLPAGLPALVRRGGVLTPATAFGDVLVTRLEETGRFVFESQIVGPVDQQQREND